MYRRLQIHPLTGLLACVVAAVACTTANAGALITGSQVGGVSIDVDGVLSSPAVEDQQRLQPVWQAALDEIPGDLQESSELRFVSLKGIEREIAAARKSMVPVPDAVECLAGLLRVQYVLVIPEQNDIILAGPAEGWRVDQLGNLVGKTSGRPVILLDDLIAALRMRRTSAQTPVSCSIDPTPEGLVRVAELAGSLKTIGDPQQTMARIEQALGPQVVTITGVPDTSHLARVMVAADFRMKRIAMGLEPAPIPNMPSFLQISKAGRRGMQNMLPRWWLAPKYEALHRSADGLAWEIRGQGVQCLTESDFVAADGSREHTGTSSPAAEKWATMMTDRFDELADRDSAFGHLRNIMDLAVVAALIEKEGLLEKSAANLPRLLDDELLSMHNPPRRVASQASIVKKGRNFMISASGGVDLQPWQVLATEPVVSADLQPVQQTATTTTNRWWWDSRK